MRPLAFLFVLLASTIALADPPAKDPDPEAQRLLDEGTRLFTEDANHQAARESFQKAYAIEPNWRALNGIALTYNEQGRFVDALATYEKLLAEFDAVLSEAQRSTVTTRLQALAAKIAVVEIAAEQKGVTVSIDSEEVGTAPLAKSIRLLPGRHIVVATLEGHRTITQAIVIKPGEKLPIKLTLEPDRVVVKVEKEALVRRFSRRTPWLVVGGGAGLIVIGGVFHALSARDFNAFDDSVGAGAGNPPMASPGDPSLHDRAVLERRVAVGSYAVGGLALLAGAVLLGLNQPRPIDVVPAKHGVSVAIRF